jgi:hypothetical protein
VVQREGAEQGRLRRVRRKGRVSAQCARAGIAVSVDLINRIGVSFDEAIADGRTFTVGECAIPVIGRDALIRAKRAAARPQDLADVDALERLVGP